MAGAGGGPSAGGIMAMVFGTLVTAAIVIAGAVYFVGGNFGGAGQSRDPERPVHLVIGLDLSESNPLVVDDTYAQKVARRIRDEILNLPLGSYVTVRTFGTFDAARNRLQVDRTISLRTPADQVAEVVGGIIAGVPTLVERGQLDAQPRTNILAFMDNMSRAVDCREMWTYYYLVTDGVEDSEYARLKDPDDTLPRNTYEKPSHAPFYRCRELIILGLGQGTRSAQTTSRLRSEWQAWADAEGFRDFQGLNDW